MKKIHSADVPPRSITVIISGTLARKLEEFSRIALTTPDELVRGMLGDRIAQDSSRGRVGEIPSSLGNYINGQNYSQERAEKVDNSCNAFIANEADQAAVVSPRENGSFQIWFPQRAFRTAA